MKTAKTKKRNFSPAQLRAQARFAKAAKAGTLKRKKRNTTIIKARKISHLDVSKVHNGLASAKKRPIAKKRNAEHRDAKHPIHVRDYWQGRTGYKSQWQRAHEAGQRQLFGVKNPALTRAQVEELVKLTRNLPSYARAAASWANYESLRDSAAALSVDGRKQIHKAKKLAYTANRIYERQMRALEKKYNKGLKAKANPRRGMRGQLGAFKRTAKKLEAEGYKVPKTQLAQPGKRAGINIIRKRRAGVPGYKRANGRKRTVKARKNGANTSLAKQRRSEFVGRPSTQMKTLYAPAGSGAKGTLSQLGKLHKISVKGGKVYNFKGVPTLAQHPKTDQLFVLGKNYTVNVPKKNPGDRMVDLGEVTRIEYEAVKTHLGDTKPVTYYHHFGEEGGKRPHALVNEEGLIIFSGGDYYIRPEGIRD